MLVFITVQNTLDYALLSTSKVVNLFNSSSERTLGLKFFELIQLNIMSPLINSYLSSFYQQPRSLFHSPQQKIREFQT